MIVGFAGLPLAGKDTAGEYLVNAYGFTRYAYADKLYEAVAALFDLTVDEVKKFKLDSNTKIVIEPLAGPSHHYREFDMRDILHRLGTEVGRNIFGRDFWVDLVEKQIVKSINNHPPHSVITDVRFPNEVKLVHDLDGIVIRIDRPQTAQEYKHESENPNDLDVDYVMLNDQDDILYFYGAIDEIMNQHLLPKRKRALL